MAVDLKTGRSNRYSRKSPKSNKVVVGKWGGHKFIVSGSRIFSFSDLTMKGSIETEDKLNDRTKYTAIKNSKPAEITLGIHLNAYFGVDVRKDAVLFIKQAQEGRADYFYVGTEKLIDCALMLTDASVKNVDIAPSGVWVGADVQITLKQCDKSDLYGTPGSSSSGGGSGGSGGGGGGGGGGDSGGGGGGGGDYGGGYVESEKETVRNIPAINPITPTAAVIAGTGALVASKVVKPIQEKVNQFISAVKNSPANTVKKPGPSGSGGGKINPVAIK